MDQYMALSKKDLMIHITMNELYNTHSLILQHIETLVSSSRCYYTRSRNNAWCSRLTINNTCVFSPMNWDLRPRKYLAKRTAPSNCLYTVDGKRPFKTSRLR